MHPVRRLIVRWHLAAIRWALRGVPEWHPGQELMSIGIAKSTDYESKMTLFPKYK